MYVKFCSFIRLEIFRRRINDTWTAGITEEFSLSDYLYYLKVIISRRVDLKGARSETRVRSVALAGTVKRGGSSSTTSFPAKSDAMSWLESRRYRDNWMGRVLLALALSLRDYDKPQKPAFNGFPRDCPYLYLDSSLSSMLHQFHRRCSTIFAEIRMQYLEEPSMILSAMRF